MYAQARQGKVFKPKTLIGVIIFHLVALCAPFVFSWPGLIVFCIMTFCVGCLGITFGYHRLLSHCSFTLPKPLRYLATFLGCLAVQGGPVKWVATHRLHHKAADTPQDPHSSEEGFWWSHILWNFYSPTTLEKPEQRQRLANDLHRDPVIRFMEANFLNLFFAHTALLGLAGYVFGGWYLALSLIVWGAGLRVVYGWHATWLVNSATHYWGYQSFPSRDKSRNNWWVAWLTFGEGWHNNHHVHPRSARMGLRWFEVDVTYWIISTLRRLGLAKNVGRVPGY